MVKLSETAIEEIIHEGTTMRVDDIVEELERHHDRERGIPRRVLEAYVRELESRKAYEFDADGFLASVDERLTNAETWAGPEHLYEVRSDRISLYPSLWHDHLDGSTDPVEYLRFLTTEDPTFVEAVAMANDSPAIPKERLINVIQVIGGVDRARAASELEATRERGTLVEDADQHPQAGVYLPGDNPEQEDRIR
jgi:hypothetical protein